MADTEGAEHKPKLVLVLGYSGAGKSHALGVFEDIGFRVIDHLPVTLLESAVKYFLHDHPRADFAVGLDLSHGPNGVNEINRILEIFKSKIVVEKLFLVCDSEIIIKRYSSTRRRHPLSQQGVDLETMVLREIALLESVRDSADEIVDTTFTSPHQLARIIEGKFATDVSQRKLYVTVFSFGFKHGVPRDVDMIYDVRFLSNPYFVSELKEKTGLESSVSQYVLGDSRTQKFLSLMHETMAFTLPEYFLEGKHYFRLGIGCTGGQHRSVAIAEELSHRLFDLNLKGVCFSVFHRDI